MTVYGYIRVITYDQNETRQLNAMRELQISSANIYIDKQSGKDFNCPMYRDMIEKLQQDDVVYIKSIDRLGRNYLEIQEQWRAITKDKGVDIVVLDMPVITEENLDRLIESRFPGLKGKLRGQLAKLYGELQKKTESAEISDAALDLRGLLDAIALMEKGLSSGRALELCIVNKSFDSYERGLIRDVIHARFPLDLMRDDLFSE